MQYIAEYLYMSKTVFLQTFSLSILVGCAPILESAAGFVHTAFLSVNEPKAVVVEQAEHVLGVPKKTLSSSFTDSSDPVEIRVYRFSLEYDLALFFQNDLFVMAIFPKKDSEDYPTSFDRQAMLNETGDVRAYSLMRKGRAVSLKPVY